MNRITFLALIGAAVAVAPVSAQNPNYAPGDLILGFQNPGGTTGSDQTVLVNLGDTALRFRDGTTNVINITNIGTTLTNTFGASWWESPTLYVGAVGVWGNSPLNSGLQNGDPHRTLYVSRPREFLGSGGSAGSPPWQILGDTDMTTGAQRIGQMADVLEVNYTTPVAVSPKDQSQLDEQNPFVQGGIQGTAYAVFSGGVQFAFGSGMFGTLEGVNAEAALDLYRIQARNNVAGQNGFGNPTRIGEFQGTIVMDQAGNVSFIVVPEPSSGLLFGAAALALGLIRRRRLQNIRPPGR